jgi:hypothetical protein
MKIDIKNRKFSVNNIEINHIADVELKNNEMITFIKDNKEYDFVAKEWGYYATPSINSRLKNFGYKTALVRNSFGQVYINIVEIEKMNKFLEYLKSENSEVLMWIDEEYK